MHLTLLSLVTAWMFLWKYAWRVGRLRLSSKARRPAWPDWRRWAPARGLPGARVDFQRHDADADTAPDGPERPRHRATDARAKPGADAAPAAGEARQLPPAAGRALGGLVKKHRRGRNERRGPLRPWWRHRLGRPRADEEYVPGFRPIASADGPG